MDNEISETWPTIFDLAKQIPVVDLTKSKRGQNVHRATPPVSDGLAPEPFPSHEGYFEATPEQLASLIVPKLEVNEENGIKGFQREKANTHARKIARALIDGKEVPPLIVSIFPDGKSYIDDGQHRALGAVIARLPVEVVVKKRTVEQARELFTNQGRARKVSTNDILLSGDSAVELYIQDACTNPDHPWGKIVAPTPRKNRISPTMMLGLVGPYAFNSLSGSARFYTGRPDEDFDVLRANQMAKLITAFGTKESNPDAYNAQVLHGIAAAAVYILRRNPKAKRGDVSRWLEHMPKFDFARFPHLRNKEQMMTFQLVEHWNKYLGNDRRVDPTTLRSYGRGAGPIY
jgi:hypothetical protein